ncbi:MAG TPA: glycosyltransferase [Acidimicrobiia bacterium]|nr:glycosyltransferase [Acidimicrobiia bacterium]
MSAPRLSVVVASRNRPAMLTDCLRTLQAQTAPGLEIVVVDDGSDAPLTSAVDAAPGPAAVRLVRQAHAGLSTARNRGTSEAAADRIAYLDDDGLADEGWAAAILDAFDATGADAVAGRIDLLPEADVPAWLTPGMRSFLGETHLGDERRMLGDNEVAFGGNFAVTRAAFDAVGGFALTLGRTGESLLSNEDVLFSRRLHQSGNRVVYEPKARMRHRVAAERLTLPFVRRRARAQGTSDVLLAEEVGIGRPGSWDDWRMASRTVPILAKGLAPHGTGAMGAVVWAEYCRGRRDARRQIRGRRSAA